MSYEAIYLILKTIIITHFSFPFLHLLLFIDFPPLIVYFFFPSSITANTWQYAYAPVTFEAIYLTFTATRGYDYEGDIAIDDIVIDTQPCYVEPAPTPTYEPGKWWERDAFKALFAGFYIPDSFFPWIGTWHMHRSSAGFT